MKTEVSWLFQHLPILLLFFCPPLSTSTIQYWDYYDAGHKDVLMTRERFSREQCGGIQVGNQIIIIVIIIVVVIVIVILALWKVLFLGS